LGSVRLEFVPGAPYRICYVAYYLRAFHDLLVQNSLYLRS
jgi:hypothetical protein